MFRGCAPKCCLENNAKFGEGIVQGVVKATQTGILWSQVQVLVGPPEKQTLISNGGVLSFARDFK
jgi:hypothetical protein